MDSTVKNLPIRKTAFMMFKHCEKQFEYFYNDKVAYTEYKQSSENQALRRGTLFHNGCEDFFNKVKKKPAQAYTKDTFRECLPIITDKKDLILNDWFDYFAKIEADRYGGFVIDVLLKGKLNSALVWF